jgi:hypothetical protein
VLCPSVCLNWGRKAVRGEKDGEEKSAGMKRTILPLHAANLQLSVRPPTCE